MTGHLKEMQVQQSRMTEMRATTEAEVAHRFKDGLGYKLSRAAKIVQSAANEVFRPLGLTRLSWTVLATIGFDGFDAPGTIARHIGIERTAVSRILRQLEADGLVERQVNERDGRGTRMVLSAAGIELCAIVPARLSSAMVPLHARLTSSQLADLCESLDLLSQSDDLIWRNERG